jgi:hypothetical protein
MKLRHVLGVAAAALAPLLLAACPGDKDTEPKDAGIPTATATAPTASATVLAPEDAGADVEDASDAADADADAAKPVGVSNLTKCCNAIKQNQKSAPPEQQLLYGAAIALCNSGQIPPQFRNLPQCK